MRKYWNQFARNIRRSKLYLLLETLLAVITLFRAGFHITHGKLSTNEDIYRLWWNDHIITDSPDICQPTPGYWCTTFNGSSKRLSRYTRDDIALKSTNLDDYK